MAKLLSKFKKAVKILSFFLIGLFFFIFSAQPVVAFFSPSTLQLIFASTGGYIFHILAIFLAWPFLVFLKLKRSHKKALAFILSFFLIIIILFAFFRFMDLRKRNYLGGVISKEQDQTFAEDKQKIELFLSDYKQKNARLAEININWNNEEKFYVDLNEITSDEVERLFKVSLMCENRNVFLKKTIFACFPDLIALIKAGEVDEFLEGQGFKKGDRILFYCCEGATSKRIAYLFSLLGYDAYYADLSGLSESRLLEFGLTKGEFNERAIITQPLLKNIQKESSLIHFIFNIDDEMYITDNFLEYFGQNLKIVLIDPKTDFVEVVDRRDLLEFYDFFEIFDQSVKIICTSNLNCLLTKYQLYRFGKDKEVNYLYQFDRVLK